MPIYPRLREATPGRDWEVLTLDEVVQAILDDVQRELTNLSEETDPELLKREINDACVGSKIKTPGFNGEIRMVFEKVGLSTYIQTIFGVSLLNGNRRICSDPVSRDHSSGQRFAALGGNSAPSGPVR